MISLLNNTQVIKVYKTIEFVYMFYWINFKSPSPRILLFFPKFSNIVLLSPQFPPTLLHISSTSIYMPYFLLFCLGLLLFSGLIQQSFVNFVGLLKEPTFDVDDLTFVFLLSLISSFFYFIKVYSLVFHYLKCFFHCFLVFLLY